MATPHPQAEILRAIADNADVKLQRRKRINRGNPEDWIEADIGHVMFPVVNDQWEFRICPEKPEPREFWVYCRNDGYVSAHGTKPKDEDVHLYIHVREVIE